MHGIQFISSTHDLVRSMRLCSFYIQDNKGTGSLPGEKSPRNHLPEPLANLH